MLTWPLYPAPSLATNLTAASIVALASTQFLLVGLGVIKDERFVRALGHGAGKERLLLYGPLQYGVVMAALTARYFRTPASVVPIAVLSFGDAAAALVGRRHGKTKLPWCKHKVCGPFALHYTTLA